MTDGKVIPSEVAGFRPEYKSALAFNFRAARLSELLAA